MRSASVWPLRAVEDANRQGVKVPAVNREITFSSYSDEGLCGMVFEVERPPFTTVP